MDYAQRRRITIWGTARVVEGDAGLIKTFRDPSYPGRVERAIVFHVEAWAMNCSKHIHRRFPEAAVASVIDQLQSRIKELEGEVADLRLGQNATETPVSIPGEDIPATGIPEDAIGQIPVGPGPEVVEDDPLVKNVTAEDGPDMQA